MPEWTGPSDNYYEPPEGPEYEEKPCKGCSTVREVNVESDFCDDCLEGMQSAADEAKYDEAKDEGRLRR